LGKAVIGFKGERALKQRHRLLSLFRHHGIDVRQRAQHEVVGIETVRPLTLDALDLGLPEARLDRADRAQRDLILECENIIERPVVTLGPDVRAGLGLD